MPVRIAVFSDVHGNLAALEAVLADIRARKPDRVICAGDLVATPLVPTKSSRLFVAKTFRRWRGTTTTAWATTGTTAGAPTRMRIRGRMGRSLWNRIIELTTSDEQGGEEA